MPLSSSYVCRYFAYALLTVCVVVLIGPSIAQSKEDTSSQAAKIPKRKGGDIRKAWPQKGSTRAPKKMVTRWLARQIGPKKARTSAQGSPRALSAQTSGGSQTLETSEFVPAAKPGPLLLTRSYDIPVNDPSYGRLLNVAWTYDTAVSAMAFIAGGGKAQAAQMLDQLSALQRTDGSIDFAFNTLNGSSMPLFRTGSIAWVGYAAAVYDDYYETSAYKKLAEGAAKWIMTQQTDSGLFRGGPDVQWASAQHNLISYFLFDVLSKSKYVDDKKIYSSPLNKLKNGIDNNIAVNQTNLAYFRQGLNDDVRALDAQTLGALYLLSEARKAQASKVLTYITSNFAVSNQSVQLSSDPATFNMTYQAPGPFSGYEPYATQEGPDILWTEGTYEVRLTMARLAASTTTLDSSLSAWSNITRGSGVGPLGANRTVTTPLNEYHVWPTSVAASWSLLAYSPITFFESKIK